MYVYVFIYTFSHGRPPRREGTTCMGFNTFLRMLVYLVIFDSAQVSLEHLLLSRHPSPRGPSDACAITSGRVFMMNTV